MTDAKFIFNQNVREKSITKRSVSKTNRTGKGAVRFPSDNLSRKEKNALNGPVETLNLNHIYTWDEFKHLSDDMKIRLVNHLINKFGVRIGTINSYYFNNNDSSCLYDYLRRHKIMEFINVGSRGGNISRSKLNTFIAFIDQNKDNQPQYSDPDTKAAIDDSATQTELKNIISKATFTMSTFDGEFIKKIFSFFNPDNIEIDITIRTKEG